MTSLFERGVRTDKRPERHIYLINSLNIRGTAARIVLDDIFRAMIRQVQYMAKHCIPKNERTQFMYKHLTKLAR